MGERIVTFTTPYDSEYYQKKVATEKNAQYWMDIWYQHWGFEIIDRTGNKKRDLVLKGKNNNFKVEEKYREKDWGDFLVEIIQDMVGNKPGWFYTETPNILNYIILDCEKKPKIAYWIQFNKFKNWFFNYLSENKHPRGVISPEGFGLTLNIAISWDFIPEDICHRYEITNSKVPY